MKLLLLSDRKSKEFDEICLRDKVRSSLEETGCEVEELVLDYEKLLPCRGCFGCWVKTPGKCVITRDEANGIAEKFMGADCVLLLSEVVYGGCSPDIKAFLDRNISNVSPFFTRIEGEMHHRKRYKKYPQWVPVGYGKISDEEKELFIELGKRNALNLHAPRHRVFVIREAAEFQQTMAGVQNFLNGGEAG